MKIVMATPILYDSSSPFNHLLKDILQSFVNAGYEVVRIVAVENLSDDEYKMGLDGIEYIPVVRKRMEKANIIKRYIVDSLTNIKMARLIKKTKADVLFEDVSYSSLWSVFASKRRRMKIVSMFQDVWPDNAVQSGLISENSFIYKIFDFLQKPVYKKSDRVICISDDMKDFIESKGVKTEKTSVIYNWGYSDEPVDIKREDNEFVKKYDLKNDKFYAVYAGNIGRMQNVRLIVEAAKRLSDKEDIHFLIVGDGVMREDIEKMTAGMKNVTMLPFQPSELATSIYSMADVNIIPLVPGGLKTALPSKIGVCLSCGNPIIACVDKGSCLEKLFEQNESGLVVSPDSSEFLAEAIEKMTLSKNKEKNYRFFEKSFKRTVNAGKYAEVLAESVIGE